MLNWRIVCLSQSIKLKKCFSEISHGKRAITSLKKDKISTNFLKVMVIIILNFVNSYLLSLFKQNNILPPKLGQMIRYRASNDPSTTYHNLCLTWKRFWAVASRVFSFIERTMTTKQQCSCRGRKTSVPAVKYINFLIESLIKLFFLKQIFSSIDTEVLDNNKTQM